jgi:hypothetical protein
MGNKLGWILSGALVAALVVVIVVMMLQGGDPSPTTLAITVPGFFEVHEVKISPAPFLGGSLPSGPGNAGDDYRQAVDLYRAHHEQVGDAEEHVVDIIKGKFNPPEATVTALESIYTLVAAGATKKEMKYSTPQDISVRAAYDPASRLALVGDAMIILGDVRMGAKKYDEAEKAYRASFALGYQMTKEGSRALMLLEGLGVQGAAVGRLGDLYSEWDKKKYESTLNALEDYAHALDKVHKECQDKMNTLWQKKPEPGDVFAIVERDQDPTWRVEGLLLCGVIRYTHPTHAGNQRVDKELVDKYAADPNPYVRAAAMAARELTPEGWKQVGTPPRL